MSCATEIHLMQNSGRTGSACMMNRGDDETSRGTVLTFVVKKIHLCLFFVFLHKSGILTYSNIWLIAQGVCDAVTSGATWGGRLLNHVVNNSLQLLALWWLQWHSSYLALHIMKAVRLTRDRLWKESQLKYQWHGLTFIFWHGPSSKNTELYI